jgi:hypothetical protein
VAPKSLARGAPRRGDRAAVGAETARLYVAWALASRYRVASSFGRHCSALRGRARFYRNPNGTRLCARSALSGSSRRAPPERCPRGPRSGIGQRRGMRRPRLWIEWGRAFRYGVASSFGRYCSALRGRTIPFVAFRASHPAKPSSRPRGIYSEVP